MTTPDPDMPPDPFDVEHHDGDIVTHPDTGEAYRLMLTVDPHPRLQLLQLLRLGITLDENNDPASIAFSPELGMVMLHEAMDMLVEALLLSSESEDPNPNARALASLDHMISIEEKLIDLRHQLSALMGEITEPGLLDPEV